MGKDEFLKLRQEYDSEDMRQDILSTPMLALNGYKIVEAMNLGRLKGKHLNIILAGMGGSGIAGLLLKNYLSDEKTMILCVQDYKLPSAADKHSLVIACSYSGNTEETLSIFKDARRRSCGLIAVTSGGKLGEYAKASGTLIISLPSGHQPRAAMTTEFFAMLRLLERLRLISNKSGEVMSLKDELKKQLGVLEENAKILSEKLVNKIPLVYTSKSFEAVGYRWKCQFNENSKIMAFSNVLPESNHNELEGYENLRGDYHAVILRFDQDHRRVQRRIRLTKETMIRKGISDTEIGIRGASMLSKMFSAVILGDLTSYYLALRLKTNPSKVSIIEDFKQELGPYVA